MRRSNTSYRLPIQESPSLAADTSGRRPDTVSATVHLDPPAMERIKEGCPNENRPTNDVIREAVCR